eukprot:375975_1
MAYLFGLLVLTLTTSVDASNVTALNPDVLQQIFKYSTVQDLYTASLVNHQLYPSANIALQAKLRTHRETLTAIRMRLMQTINQHSWSETLQEIKDFIATGNIIWNLNTLDQLLNTVVNNCALSTIACDTEQLIELLMQHYLNVLCP